MDGNQGDKKIRITLFTHFASLLSLLIVVVLFAGLLLWLKCNIDALIGIGIFLGGDAIPALYLHIEYWMKNKGEEYEIRDSEIILRKHGKEITYKSHDIEKIIVCLSPSLYKNSNFHLLAIEGYHYAKIRLKTGEELVLTCLLAPRIDKALMQMRGVLLERRKRLFCSVT